MARRSKRSESVLTWDLYDLPLDFADLLLGESILKMMALVYINFSDVGLRAGWV